MNKQSLTIIITGLVIVFCCFVACKQTEASTWSQTTQAEFEEDTLTAVNTYISPGDVKFESDTKIWPDGNTVLLMHFNEGSSNPQDSSGNGNHGTNNGTTWTTSGKFGNALTFNGSTGYVDCGTSDSLDITNEITIEAWIKGTYGAAALHSVVAKYGGTDSNYYMVVYQQNLRGLAADSSDSEKIIQTDTVLADDTWYHAAFTAKNNEQKL